MVDLTGADGGLRELALFAGAGGGILGGKLLGWRTVCAVERDAYAAQVLAQRQNDGILQPFPIWSDVCGFDGKPWRGIVDVVSGGFPCQDISAAGKGTGITGARSGLWKQMARIIGEVRPQFVFVENSPMLITRGIASVIGDLSAMGYDARWGVVGAVDCGAPHERKRCWIVGYPHDNGRVAAEVRKSSFTRGNHNQKGQAELVEFARPSSEGDSHDGSDANCKGGARLRSGAEKEKPLLNSYRKHDDGNGWWEAEPCVGRMADGVAYWMDKLRAIGNGQVPSVAATAWRLLS